MQRHIHWLVGRPGKHVQGMASIVVDQEIRTWEARCEKLSGNNRPSTLASAIKECDGNRFPNVFILLKNGCTLPVTSCECERGFFRLKKVKHLASVFDDHRTFVGLRYYEYSLGTSC